MKKERFTLPFVPQLLCIHYNKQVFDYQLFIAGMEHSYDGNNWFEFTKEQVEADGQLFWNTVEDPNTHMTTDTYYFAYGITGVDDVTSVKFKVTAINGQIKNIILNPQTDGVGTWAGALTKDTVYTLNAGNTYKFEHDDGIRTIMWNSGEDTDADGSRGHVGIKEGATVTVKLIPDYGYQLQTFSLNGETLTPQRGDYLSKIARKNGLTLVELATHFIEENRVVKNAFAAVLPPCFLYCLPLNNHIDPGQCRNVLTLSEKAHSSNTVSYDIGLHPCDRS